MPAPPVSAIGNPGLVRGNAANRQAFVLAAGASERSVLKSLIPLV